MGRSRPRRAGGRAVSLTSPGPSQAPTAPEGATFAALNERVAGARRLFDYAGAWAPPPFQGEIGWGAWVGGAAGGWESGEYPELIGAVLLESQGPAGMIHGPVVVVGPHAYDPVEIAAHLLASLLPDASRRGVQTLFARPQGLDRVWVRFGFIPVPEADLPRAFKGRPGVGLFAWRGGTALWSSRKPLSDTDHPTLPPPIGGAREL